MTAAQLLRLYPRAWRDRYGDEFLDTVGTERLHLQQIIDIVSGAIDAWLSADVRGAARAPAPSTGGRVITKTMVICKSNETRYTKRDAAIGAAVMLVGAAMFAILGLAFRLNGFGIAAGVALNSGFLVALTLSLPFWLMKGQPREAQAVIVGGTIAIVITLNIAAALISGR